MMPPRSPMAETTWFLRFAWSLSAGASLLLHGAAIGLLWWFVRPREDLVILRYNAYLGIDLLGVWWQIFLVPALTFFFVLVNLGIAQLVLRRGYPSVAALFLLGSLLLSLAVLVVAATLSFINT